MESPSPRSDQQNAERLYEADEHDHPLWNYPPSITPLYRVLSLLLVSLALAALAFSSLPLWRPIAALLLHKLWDVLRFLVLTTSIGLAILNSRLWRATYTEGGAHPSTYGSGKEDSLSSKVPFVGMLYGDVQHSYSFSDKEAGAGEYGLMSRAESETDVGPRAAAATWTDTEVHDGQLGDASTLLDGHHRNEASSRANNDHQPCMQPNSMLMNCPNSVVSTRRGISHIERDGVGTSDTLDDKEAGAVNGEASTDPSTYMHRRRRNAVTVVSRGKHRLVQPYDDPGLAAVAQEPKQSGTSSKIIHRRGSSLMEFPITQEWGTASIPEDDVHTTTNHHRAPHEQKPSSLQKATSPATAFGAAVHEKKNGSIPAAHQPQHVDGTIPGAVLKHNRSQSAYNFNELLVQQRPRSKPSSSSQALSKRRNVSLSCDLDKQFGANGGMLPWLSCLPAPPEPPVVYSTDDIVKNRDVVPADVAAESKQDERTLRKAFAESLAPWRAATHTAPVNIPTHTHKGATQSNYEDSLTKTMKISRAESTISSPNYTMGSPSPSPSPGELNKKVDAFIARFHERMRLQRLESLERSRQKGL